MLQTNPPVKQITIVPPPPSRKEQQASEKLLPPSTIEGEEAVLGALILNSEVWHEVNFLQGDDFFLMRHKMIYEAMDALIKRDRAFDNVTLSIELTNRKQLDEVGGEIGGHAYISRLMNNTPTFINAPIYARMVEAAAIRRRILDALGQSARLALEENSEIGEICNQVQATVMNAAAVRDHQRAEGGLGGSMSRYFDRVDMLSKNQNKLPGITTGFSELDALTAGLQKAELTLLAARPGMGKTAFLIGLALAAARVGMKVALYSLEMVENQIMGRIVAMETGIDGDKLRRGNLDENEWKLFVEASGRLSKLSIGIRDNPYITPLQIRTGCRRTYRETGLDLVLVDYLQLMQPDKREETRDREMGQVSRALKTLANELNIPVIAAAQLNRNLETRQNKRPLLSDLRDSGNLEQDADNVWFLYRDGMYDKNTAFPNRSEVIVAKQRNGKLDTVYLDFDGPHTRFTALKPTKTIDLKGF